MPLQQNDKRYTYEDYLTWPEDERWEIIDGVPYLQAAPTWQHQAISRELLTQFNNYLKDNPCQVFSSPFDLRLPEKDEKDEETTFVVQPDLLVVCDREGLKGTGYYGTPALVIEISSPSTVRSDKVLKFNRYEKAGVKEYWIVEPDGKFISVFTLQSNHRYGRPEFFTETDKLPMSAFPDVIIDLKPVFDGL
ncbi:Uma2 family endonuclease [Desulfitobacterium sp.]|uniref:Uma2 family endonuclease n=1 Tax=Desulfitobacterium sp. TaxID=49981 RepID=UPI002C45D77B|nr:Uma2 family endonuclease [Desulfitobacterium sp.]HVJ48454.1 Uma2 family endonuclease [Desulfitobacterium sp.]